MRWLYCVRLSLETKYTRGVASWLSWKKCIGARAQQLRSFYSRIFPAISPHTIGPRLLSVNICKQELQRNVEDVYLGTAASAVNQAELGISSPARSTKGQPDSQEPAEKPVRISGHHFRDAGIACNNVALTGC
jgi:hypothetical protein